MAETYTLTEYRELRAAIAQGARVVQYADKRVEYRSLDEMLRLKRTMEGELGIGSGDRGPQRRRMASDKGL